jgi:hypothetical protein
MLICPCAGADGLIEATSNSGCAWGENLEQRKEG